MQGGSLYHFYDGLWYDPAERRTHDLPCERRARYRLSQPDTVYLHDVPIPNDQNVMKADILIGMDNAHLLVPYEVKSSPSAKNEPFVTRTYFGWALSGPIFGQSDQAYANFIQGSIEKDFENMWTIEHEVGESSESELSLNDRKVLNLWDEQTVYENNRYTIPIPW